MASTQGCQGQCRFLNYSFILRVWECNKTWKGVSGEFPGTIVVLLIYSRCSPIVFGEGIAEFSCQSDEGLWNIYSLNTHGPRTALRNSKNFVLQIISYLEWLILDPKPKGKRDEIQQALKPGAQLSKILNDLEPSILSFTVPCLWLPQSISISIELTQWLSIHNP